MGLPLRILARLRPIRAAWIVASVLLAAPALRAQEPKPDPDPPAETPETDESDLLEIEGLEGLEGLDGFGAADGGETGDAVGGIRVTNFEGFLESRGKFFYRDRHSDGGLEDGQWIQELQLEFDFALGDVATGYFRPRFMIDVLDEDLVRTDPLEAYVTIGGDGYDVRAGMFVENWGIADTFNPIDVLNRRDLASDPLDFERLGEIGGRLRFWGEGGDTIAEPTLALYAIPVFQEAEFPTPSSRWSFAQPPNSILEQQDVSPAGEERIFAAARASAVVSTGLANADVQLVAARGPERFPLFQASAAAGGGLDFTPVYYGAWTFGGGFRAVPNADGWSDYTLKAEVVYKVPYRVASPQPTVLPDEYLQYAFGFDRLFPRVFSERDQVTATVEWVGETGADDSTAGFRPFDDDLVLRAFWEANDFARTSVELRGFLDASSGEWVLEGILERQLRAIHEDVQLELGIQVFDAARSEPGLFSIYPNNSNISLALRWDF